MPTLLRLCSMTENIGRYMIRSAKMNQKLKIILRFRPNNFCSLKTVSWRCSPTKSLGAHFHFNFVKDGSIIMYLFFPLIITWHTLPPTLRRLSESNAQHNAEIGLCGICDINPLGSWAFLANKVAQKRCFCISKKSNLVSF